MLEGVRQWAARLLAARQVAPEKYPEIRFVTLGNVPIRVHSPEDALKISTVWRCVTLIANTVGALQWRVRKVVGETTRDRADHPVDWLLNYEPNEELSALDFRRTLIQHVLLYGNGYAEVERNGAGVPVALWPIAPDRVEPERDADGRLYYKISNPSGGLSFMAPRDIYHVRGPGWDGVRGYSIMEVAAQSMRNAGELDRFAGNFFASGMTPSGVFEVPPEVRLSLDGFRALEERIKRKFQGADNAGSPLILDGGTTYKPISSDPERAQFLDTRKFSVYDVCRWFGVPPYLAFASDEQPRANVETQSREFYSYGLMPVILAFEQEANKKLLGYRAGHYSQMNTDELLRGDYQTLAQYYKTMREIGVFTVNDVLRMEGMDTIGPEGDVRHMQVQNQPISGGAAPTVPDGGANAGNG